MPENRKGAPGGERLSDSDTNRGTDGVGSTVAPGTDERARVEQTALEFGDEFPAVRAFRIDPDGFHDWHWVGYLCPYGCPGMHLGTSPEPIGDGLRGTRCGRPVRLVVDGGASDV
jgi:hypothetical protein